MRCPLYGRIGRGEAARAELSAAVELPRAMEMTHGLNGAEAELASVRRIVTAAGGRGHV